MYFLKCQTISLSFGPCVLYWCSHLSQTVSNVKNILLQVITGKHESKTCVDVKREGVVGVILTACWAQQKIFTIFFFSSGSVESLCSKLLKSCTDWSGRGSVPTSGGSQSGAPDELPDCSIWRTVVFCCLMVFSETRTSRSIALKEKNKHINIALTKIQSC